MKIFNVHIPAQSDIPAALEAALRHMGSLAVSRNEWARLLTSLGVNLHFAMYKGEAEKLVVVAEHIVKVAVPEEGDPHPQRAKVFSWNPHRGQVGFATPGGVKVIIQTSPSGGVMLGFAFGRNSAYLATCVLGSLVERVPKVSRILARAARELAAREKTREQWDESQVPAEAVNPLPVQA